MGNTTWQDETVQALKQGYQDEIEKLKAERDALRAVVEAARSYVHTCGTAITDESVNYDATDKAYRELAAALARVDGEK